MTQLHRAVVRAYTAGTHKADVQLATSVPALITGVPVATDIPAADVVAGRECAVLFFTDDNPDDAVVVTIHGALPSGGGVSDHGALTGLLDDDHTQHPLLAGRAAGQNLAGGTATNEVLTLRGTANATPGAARVDLVESHLRFATAGKLIQDSDAQTRIQMLEGIIGTGNFPDAGIVLRDAVGLNNLAGQPAVGVAARVYVAAFGDQFWQLVRQGGLDIGAPLGTPVGDVLGRGHRGAWLADTGITPFISDSGLLRGFTTTGTVARAQDAAGSGLHVRFTSGAVDGNDCGIEQTNALLTRDFALGTQLWWTMAKFRLATTTLVRAFIGLTDQSLATMVGSDDPAGNYVGLQYSTPRGDTAWQWVAKNGVTQNRTAAPAITTDWFFLRFRLTSTLMIAQLFDRSFAHLGAKIFTGGPAKTVPLRLVVGAETKTAAARTIDLGYAHTVMDA